jgi:hypothetical protein
LIQAGKFQPYTSPYATDEIDDEPDQKKRQLMWQLIDDYGVGFLEDSPEVKQLAALYVQEEAVPASCTIDAAHIAITALNGLDFIVSLNFKHIARPWTIERVRRVNGRIGLKGIGIYRPAEVLNL